ncbi:complex 1 protein [Teladorsagia circumcincta]|uniref:Complex 1 protein n=1 Tax=Teladorsagia circumcincta TaxID=45464 RepID=A0A2G9URQ8_TELCI|nr:complex 1 protein [Teladorsagia circumcincta]
MSAAGKIIRGGANAVRQVAPVQSVSKDQARRSVLQVYKDLQRITPTFWWDFGMVDMPLGVFRSVLKQQFMKNAHIDDIRIVDRLVAETRQHMVAIKYAFYNPDHVRNFLFRENVQAKPKDFLSKFLNGQE